MCGTLSGDSSSWMPRDKLCYGWSGYDNPYLPTTTSISHRIRHMSEGPVQAVTTDRCENWSKRLRVLSSSPISKFYHGWETNGSWGWCLTEQEVSCFHPCLCVQLLALSCFPFTCCKFPPIRLHIHRRKSLLSSSNEGTLHYLLVADNTVRFYWSSLSPPWPSDSW